MSIIGDLLDKYGIRKVWLVNAERGVDYVDMDEVCIDYWRRRSGKADPTQCPVCQEAVCADDMVGAHVKYREKNEKTKSGIFITPTCNGCNASNSPQPFLVDENYLVRVPLDTEL